MKNYYSIKIAIFFGCAFLFSSLRIIAQSETESNDTYQSANNLIVNTDILGTVGYTVDIDDWYIITLPADGKIEVVETMTSQLYSGIFLLDSGTNQFAARTGLQGLPQGV